MFIFRIFLTFALMNDFSLLLSIYKHENPDYVVTCFDSIYSQTVLPTEIVLVEDGPLTSELYKVLEKEEKRFPCMKRVVLEKNQGLGVSLRKGLEACTHDIVARMDTDDICLPKRFEIQINYMQAHPDIDVLGAWITEFEYEPSNAVAIRCLPEEHKEIYNFGKLRNPMNHPVVMFRKKAVLDVGSYQPCYLFEDYYLWGRMLVKGYHFHNLQQSLLLFRRSPEMIQRRGGLSYAFHEIAFLKKLQKTGYISSFNLIRDVSQRYIVRILPNSLRRFVSHLIQK